ncbi:MAG: polyprenyl synthetase family protein [Acidobacteriota bacterium]|nr:polyprenyl synthetase family protein [Acidobacteriota bacterium]
MLTDRPAGPLSRNTAVEDEVLGRLRDLCDVGGLQGLAATIDDLVGFVRDDLAALEEGLAALSTGDTLVGEAGASLVHLGGKRLRPLCVVLASRVGSAQPSAVRDIAVAAELVHNATLLHDDVVDHADQRRGRPTARVELGNAASIFAGDYLLIEALNRVRRAAVPGVMEGLLETIAEMIRAESLQLENRGSLDASEDLYFEVARGKSAALFSWALGAGALSGGASSELCRALRAYGESIGVAFQLIDDLLDLVGHHSNTGKTLFSDLSEGKITYPLIVVLDREPALADTIRAIAAEATPSWDADGLGLGYAGSNGDGSANGHPGGANGEGRERERVLEAMLRYNVEATCRDLAASYIDEGIAALAKVPDGPARRALTVVARASVLRER